MVDYLYILKYVTFSELKNLSSNDGFTIGGDSPIVRFPLPIMAMRHLQSTHN